jgi:Fic family protein
MSHFAVAWEEHPWETDPDAAMSRRVRRLAHGPYRAAVPARIADSGLALPTEVSALAEDALIELARFDADLAAASPWHEGEELAPLDAVLLRTESASSSQIENVTAGAKSLALATIDERTGMNARMVAANVAAMRMAIELSEELSVDAILAMHGALLAEQAHAQPGRIREEQVWIGGGSSPHSAAFVPPDAGRVREALDDLLTFCERTDVAVLPQIAIAHAQFETIHPFLDGNGRTGRALVQAMLRHSRTTRRLTVPVSAGLLAHTEEYFGALTAYRDGDPVPIIECFAEAAFAAVVNGRRLVADLRHVADRWRAEITARRGATAWRLISLVISQPAITVRYVQERTGVSQPAAARAIAQLVEAGVLTPSNANRRNRVWIAPEVIRSLDDFSARAGRRS